MTPGPPSDYTQIRRACIRLAPLALAVIVPACAGPRERSRPPALVPNSNEASAGRLRDGIVGPGATDTLAVRATTAGNFIYRATSTSAISRRVRIGGAMAGAMVVDAPGAQRPPRERVMVI